MEDERNQRLVVAAWVHRITRELKGNLAWTKLFAGTTADPNRKFSEHRIPENGLSWSWETESAEIASGVVVWLWEIGCEGGNVRYHEPGRHVYLYRMVTDITNQQPPPTPEGIRAQRILSLVERISKWAREHGEPGSISIGLTHNPELSVRELLRENPSAVYQVWDAGSVEMAHMLLRHFRKQGYGVSEGEWPFEGRYLVCKTARSSRR